MPPTNRISTSMPSTTASVTIAPMTPPTAVEMPKPESLLEPGVVADDGLELEEEEVVLAQTSTVLPHALHQVAWSPMAILDISELKVLHGRVVWDWPKRG